MIYISLTGDSCLMAEFPNQCRRHSICSIFLVGTELQDYAPIQIGTVGRTCLFRIVRVHSMCIVRRQHKASRHRLPVLSGRTSQRLIDAQQRVQKQRRRGPLSGSASHLFIIIYAKHRNLIVRFRCQKCLKTSKDTLQVIQSATGNIFSKL